MRITIQGIVLALSMQFILPCQAQAAEQIFPKGELSTVKNHTGNIWLKELVVGDATFDPSVAVATYDAGARLDWHVHPGGQVLLITEGAGYYQERGKAARIVHKGDVIQCPPGVEHLARSVAYERLCLHRGYSDSKGKDHLVRAGQR